LAGAEEIYQKLNFMTLEEILQKLQSLGSEQIKKILLKHGAREPLFGVKIGDMKKILKGIRGDNKLAIDLFNTGNYDAMYLAGLVADGSKMRAEEINRWAGAAYGSGISGYTVPWVATENQEGFNLAMKWIDSPVEDVAVAGWSTLSSIVSFWPDETLDHGALKSLLDRAERDIRYSPGQVKTAMNGFIISTGCYVPLLMHDCIEIAGKIGTITVDSNGTACRIPSAADYILKVNKMGRTGQKRKTVKC
jgi:hypothetical protein